MTEIGRQLSRQEQKHIHDRQDYIHVKDLLEATSLKDIRHIISDYLMIPSYIPDIMEKTVQIRAMLHAHPVFYRTYEWDSPHIEKLTLIKTRETFWAICALGRGNHKLSKFD